MTRLKAHLEAAGICRRAETDGGFATILRKGDPERGALLLVITSRGQHVSCLERTLSIDGEYSWGEAGPQGTESPEKLADFLTRRARYDDDLWLIELDVADPERFIAETINSA